MSATTTEPTEYEQLPDSYKDHSLVFRLVKRTGDVAMFAAWADGHEPREWEVMVVQRQKAWVSPSKKAYPPKEKVPAPEEWGRYAWTYTEKEGAESRFRMLVQEQHTNETARPATTGLPPESPQSSASLSGA